MTAPWTGDDGLRVTPILPGRDDWRAIVVDAPRRRTVLTPERARTLRDWLTAHLDDDGRTPPARPDAVRLAIDAQRAALRARSEEACSEDFRAGLAWCDSALRAIAEAAS